MLRWLQLGAPLVVLVCMPAIGVAEDADALLELARVAPPELAAHTILQVTNAGLVPDDGRATTLLEEAYRRAGEAQEPMAWRTESQDTRLLTLWFPFGLDTISLRSQVVLQMLKADPGRAREMLAELREPPVEPTNCMEDRVADFAPLWSAVEGVARQGHDVEWLAGRMNGIAWISEIAAAAQLIARWEGPVGERQRLAAALSAAIRDVPTDPLGFASSSARNHDALKSAIVRLRTDGSEQAAYDLVAAYRTLVVRQLSGFWCRDGAIDPSPAPAVFRASALNSQMGSFNLLLMLLPISDLQPIELHDVRGGVDFGGPLPDEGWTPPETDRLTRRMIDLGADYTEPRKQTEAWRNEVRKVAEDVLGFLASDSARDVRERRRRDWYAQALLLLDMARHSGSDMRLEVLSVFEASGDAALRLLVRLEELLPKPEPASPTSVPGRSG